VVAAVGRLSHMAPLWLSIGPSLPLTLPLLLMMVSMHGGWRKGLPPQHGLLFALARSAAGRTCRGREKSGRCQRGRYR
jgi:hypothetical protein